MRVNQILTMVFFAVVLMVVTSSFQYSARARFGPLLVGIPTAILILVQIVRDNFFENLTPKNGQGEDATTEKSFFPNLKGFHLPYLEIAACLFGLLTAIYLVGLLVAYPVFIIAYLKLHREGWLMSIALGLGLLALIYGVFGLGLGFALYEGILWE